MLLMLRSLFAPKERISIRMTGRIGNSSFQFETQRLVSQLGLLGYMTVDPWKGAVLEVEGPKPKLDELIKKMAVIGGRAQMAQMQVSRKPFKGDMAEFRIQNN